MSFQFHDHRIPPDADQAVTPGWGEASGGRPLGVTWHWTATWDLAECRRLLGGRRPARCGIASAHYGVGRSFAEGVDVYVSLEDRSWHAGKDQTLRYNGKPYTKADHKGARTTIGVETVNIGYAREDVEASADWIETATPGGRPLRVQPWTAEQMEMMVAVGREILARWPHIGPLDHHGHCDLCPAYKEDPVGFPFVHLLRLLYDDPTIPDVWTPYQTLAGRRQALAALGFDPDAQDALCRFQRTQGLVEDGQWTVFVSRRVHELLCLP